MNRNHQLCRGVWVSSPVEDMTREELENALYDVAEFASKSLQEARTLRRLITDQLQGRHRDE